MKRLILLNTRPIALVVFGGIVGYFCSTVLAGVLIALGVIALVHLFL
jgi:hypothetical protein